MKILCLIKQVPDSLEVHMNSGLTLEQFKAFVPAGYTVTETNGSFTVSK